MDYAAILKEAHNAARLAVALEHDREPENPSAFDCGFAWVTIGGTDGLARYCRKMLPEQNGPYYGDRGATAGWTFWKPGAFKGQSIRIHRVGSNAFADVLARHGIRAAVGSRLD